MYILTKTSLECHFTCYKKAPRIRTGIIPDNVQTYTMKGGGEGEKVNFFKGKLEAK